MRLLTVLFVLLFLFGCGIGSPLTVDKREDVQKLVEANKKPMEFTVALLPAKFNSQEAQNEYSAVRMPDGEVFTEELSSTLSQFRVFKKVKLLKGDYNPKTAEVSEKTLKEAKAKGYDLLLLPRIKRAEVFYIGTTGAYIPNLILWFFFDFFSWFVADEEYGYALEGSIDIVSVHTAKRLYSVPIKAEVRGALTDFQRGIKVWGIIRVPSHLNDKNWDNVSKVLTPHLIEEAKLALLKGMWMNFAAYTKTPQFAAAFKPPTKVAVKPPVEEPPKEKHPKKEPPKKKPPKKKKPPIPPKPKKPLLCAVVVGVEKYEDVKLGEAEFALSDAKAVADIIKTLKKYEVKMQLLIDKEATRDALQKAIKTISECDLFIFYFAGNGATPPGAKEAEQYLLLADSKSSDINTTAISLRKLTELLNTIRAKDGLVLLDAGFASKGVGRTFDVGELKVVYPRVSALNKLKFTALIACTSRQTALTSPLVKHGFFTHYLLKAVRGAADTDGNGKLTAEEILNFIKPKVAEQAQTEGITQTPVILGDRTVTILLK